MSAYAGPEHYAGPQPYAGDITIGEISMTSPGPSMAGISVASPEMKAV